MHAPAVTSSVLSDFNMNPKGVVGINILLVCLVQGFDIHVSSQYGRIKRSENIGDTCNSIKCDEVSLEHYCQQNYLQARARLYFSCSGYEENDVTSSSSCIRHENGTLCAILIGNRYDLDLDPNGYCLSNSTCNQQCAVLLQQLKDTWGCCFQVLFNVSYSYYQLANYSIWNQCDIQPPERCPLDVNSIEVNDLADCSSEEQLGHLLSEFLCTIYSRQSINSLLENENCAQYFTSTIYDYESFCVLKDEKFCFEMLFYLNQTDYLMDMTEQVCSDVTDVCTSDCKEALQTLRDRVGCCLHGLNNTSPCSNSYIPSYMDYEVWHSCGVKPPGLCSSTNEQPRENNAYQQVLSKFLLVSIILYWLFVTQL